MSALEAQLTVDGVADVSMFRLTHDDNPHWFDEIYGDSENSEFADLLDSIDDCFAAFFVNIQIRLHAVSSACSRVRQTACDDGIPIKALLPGEVFPDDHFDIWAVGNFVKHADTWATPLHKNQQDTANAIARLGLIELHKATEPLVPWPTTSAALAIAKTETLSMAMDTIVRTAQSWCTQAEEQLLREFGPLKTQIAMARTKSAIGAWGDDGS